MLYVVSTPIGNLGDLTHRALEVLRTNEIIFAEDTRRTKVLLKHYGINAKLLSYNDYNKISRTKHALNIASKNIVLVSDNGTPTISDPGFYIIREFIKHNIKVTPIPGPSALIAALSASGFPTDKFSFYGFFPKQKTKAIRILDELKDKDETVIFYESSHRINKTLRLISEIIPRWHVCIARELTKRFEEFIYGYADELLGRQFKGEMVLLLSSKGMVS